MYLEESLLWSPDGKELYIRVDGEIERFIMKEDPKHCYDFEYLETIKCI